MCKYNICKNGARFFLGLLVSSHCKHNICSSYIREKIRNGNRLAQKCNLYAQLQLITTSQHQHKVAVAKTQALFKDKPQQSTVLD